MSRLNALDLAQVLEDRDLVREPGKSADGRGRWRCPVDGSPMSVDPVGGGVELMCARRCPPSRILTALGFSDVAAEDRLQAAIEEEIMRARAREAANVALVLENQREIAAREQRIAALEAQVRQLEERAGGQEA